jgi:hypothetical protein
MGLTYADKVATPKVQRGGAVDGTGSALPRTHNRAGASAGRPQHVHFCFAGWQLLTDQLGTGVCFCQGRFVFAMWV